jgi:hypothetical protein
MHTLTLSTGLLFANAVWDFISSVSICFFVSYRRCASLANMHLGLWVDEEEQMNESLATVMSVLLLQWGLVRLRGSLEGPVSEATCVDASLTYMLEAALILIEVVSGKMHWAPGWFVVIACVVCWVVVMGECFQLY